MRQTTGSPDAPRRAATDRSAEAPGAGRDKPAAAGTRTGARVELRSMSRPSRERWASFGWLTGDVTAD